MEFILLFSEMGGLLVLFSIVFPRGKMKLLFSFITGIISCYLLYCLLTNRPVSSYLDGICYVTSMAMIVLLFLNRRKMAASATCGKKHLK